MTKINYHDHNKQDHIHGENLLPAMQPQKSQIMKDLNANREIQDRPRINNEIRVYKVRLIDSKGDNVGVVDIRDALYKAREAGLDLVEVVPTSQPPVCKIMDLGKWLFEKKKKAKENTHKAPETHEIRLTPVINIHDIEIKSKKAIEFLSEGSKVILHFKVKGREAKHKELIVAVAQKFFEFVKEKATLEEKGGVYILSPK
jgi:translation initiation factor IF-3